MTANADTVRLGLEAWQRGDLEGLRAVLDPQVELLGFEPGEWDCHGRDAVVQLLGERIASGRDRLPVTVDAIDDETLLAAGPAVSTRAAVTLITLREGLVRRMAQFRTREEALAAARAARHEPS
jgi:ketosteroid isomerase-like protein